MSRPTWEKLVAAVGAGCIAALIGLTLYLQRAEDPSPAVAPDLSRPSLNPSPKIEGRSVSFEREIELAVDIPVADRQEIDMDVAFCLDTTGSMSDEIAAIKRTLRDVADRRAIPAGLPRRAHRPTAGTGPGGRPGRGSGAGRGPAAGGGRPRRGRRAATSRRRARAS